MARDSADDVMPPRASAGRPGDLVTDLYRVHALGLIRVALLMVGDRPTAEDVVQEAFSGLHRRQNYLRDPGKALPYLRTSVMNGCRSVLRSRQRAREVLVLRYYSGLTDQEIAGVLRISRSAVAAYASRALAVLARELREEP